MENIPKIDFEIKEDLLRKILVNYFGLTTAKMPSADVYKVEFLEYSVKISSRHPE